MFCCRNVLDNALLVIQGMTSRGLHWKTAFGMWRHLSGHPTSLQENGGRRRELSSSGINPLANGHTNKLQQPWWWAPRAGYKGWLSHPSGYLPADPPPGWKGGIWATSSFQFATSDWKHPLQRYGIVSHAKGSESVLLFRKEFGIF